MTCSLLLLSGKWTVGDTVFMASPVRGCYKVQARDAGVVGWVTAVQREEQGLQEVLGDTLAGPRG